MKKVNYVLVENNTKSNTKLRALNKSARIQKLWFIISLAITKIKLKQNSPSVEIMFNVMSLASGHSDFKHALG